MTSEDFRLPLWFVLQLSPEKLMALQDRIKQTEHELGVAQERQKTAHTEVHNPMIHDADTADHLEEVIPRLRSDLIWYRGGLKLLTDQPEDPQTPHVAKDLIEFYELYEECQKVRIITPQELEELFLADKPKADWPEGAAVLFPVWQRIQERAVPIIRKFAADQAAAT